MKERKVTPYKKNKTKKQQQQQQQQKNPFQFGLKKEQNISARQALNFSVLEAKTKDSEQGTFSSFSLLKRSEVREKNCFWSNWNHRVSLFVSSIVRRTSKTRASFL